MRVWGEWVLRASHLVRHVSYWITSLVQGVKHRTSDESSASSSRPLKPIKVLLLTKHLDVGGIGRYTISLAKGLKNLGVTVTIASSGGEWVSQLKKDGIRHIPLDLWTKSELSPKVYRAIRFLEGVVREEQFDLIHAQTRVTQVVAAFLSRSTGIPYVTTCHGIYKRRLGRRLFACWGDRVIAISPVVSWHLIEDFEVSKERVHLVFNATEVNRFPFRDASKKEILRVRYGLPPQTKVVGAICRFVQAKGLHILLDAFGRLKIEDPKAVLILVGRGEEEKRLRQQAKELGIASRVYFIGEISSSEEILPVFDIFVHPALWREGFGLSLIEAMACGLPTVVSRVGALDAIVEEGETGFLSAPGDSQQLSEKIGHLLKDKVLCEQMGRAGRRRVEVNFSAERMASETKSVYEELLTHHILAKRILVVNVNWIGDSLFSTPFLRALRTLHPTEHLACLTVPRCREVLEKNPHLDELILYEDMGKHRGLLGKWRLVRSLRRKHFDTVYLLHRSFTRRLLVTLAGIPHRVGYAVKWGRFLLTEPHPEPKGSLHKADYFLRLLPQASGTVAGGCELLVDTDEETYARSLLSERRLDGKPFVVLNPGGNWEQKRWPIEHFATLAERLSKEGKGIVVTGEKKDLPLADQIAASMTSPPLIACGRTTLRQLAALMRLAECVVTGDSGPMHVAQSQGVRLVAIFGPTSPWVTGPYGDGRETILRRNVGCNDDPPCYYVDCPDTICMKAVTVEDVLDAVAKRKD